ncbi:MAG: ATP synthase F0 subunit B [Proteobacteria bacterium]|nr:ATP synthase F0 subunit B [Pseudomonadota bacterium]MBU2261161.1 ATP synthase F0 subunit B [Pseudomonadota bacterium]
MISLDYSLGFQIINFLLLILVLNRLLYKPIMGIIDKRAKKLEGSEAEINRLQETVEQKVSAYQEKLRLAKAAAVEHNNEIIRQGAEEAKAVIAAVRAEIPVMMEQFQARMEAEIAEAKRILTGRSRSLSLEIAEKVLGRSLR